MNEASVKFTIQTPPGNQHDHASGADFDALSAEKRRAAARGRRMLGSSQPEEPMQTAAEEEVIAEPQQEKEAAPSVRRFSKFFRRRAEEFDSTLTVPDTDPESITFEAAPRQRWRGGWAFLAVFALLGVFGWFAMGFQESLPLGRITVEGATLLTPEEIISLAKIDRGAKFYDIDLKRVRANLEKHSLIKAAYPRRESNPATIVLSIVEREPVALLRNKETNENLLIDREGFVLHPNKLIGLRDPSRLLEVPLLSGVGEKDTADYRAMVRLIHDIEFLDSGKTTPLIGELKKTPSGSYIAYTTETQTPILLGSPADHPFIASLEIEHAERVRIDTSNFFVRQLGLLAKAWNQNLEAKVRAHDVLYIDARFAGQIVVRERRSNLTQPTASTSTAQATPTEPQNSAASLIPDFVDASADQSKSVSKTRSPAKAKGSDSRQ